MELVFNINKFDLVYKDVERLSITVVSMPFYPEGMTEAYVKIAVKLIRGGEYEVKEVENRNINIPYSFLDIFAKFKAGLATEADVLYVNAFISNINSDIVVKTDNPIYIEENPYIGGEETPPTESNEETENSD